jgi:hypothetical protein
MRDWQTLAYLERGTPRQRAAFQTLTHLNIMPALRHYNPVLVGTVPLNIDIAGSDLDIVCQVESAADLDVFRQTVEAHLGTEHSFRQRRYRLKTVPTYVARVETDTFPVEVFAQPLPVASQAAYRHLCVEYRLLQLADDTAAAREAIRQLKRSGLKTEPAFAQYFGIPGDPYQALLRLSHVDEATLRGAITTGR